MRSSKSRQALYRRLETQIDELWTRLGGLPTPVEASGIWRGIWYEETHHSTALEGNTLVLKQVESLLAEGRAIGDRELKEYMEVRGYADAADWVYGQAIEPGGWSDGKHVTLTEVRRVHEMAMTPVWGVEPHPDGDAKEGPGSFRRHDIHPFPGGTTPPSWVEVPAMMHDWVREANRLRGRSLDFPEAMAALHCEFERIHPFLDGNGRAGRLVLNLLLVRLGYPPAIVYKKQRDRYLAALRRADAGDPGPLGDLLAKAILHNLYRFVVPAIAGPVRLVPIAALATEQVNVNALRAAAVRGRLQAVKGSDGEWRSSRNWVDEYTTSRYRRQ